MTVLLLTACSSKIANEIVEYNNEFLIKDYYDETLVAVDLWDELEEVYLDDAYEEKAIYFEHELIPHGEKIVNLLKDVEIDSDELQDVHHILVAVEEARLEAYKKELAFLQTNEEDSDLEDEMYDLYAKSHELNDEFIEKYDELSDKYDVEEVEED